MSQLLRVMCLSLAFVAAVQAESSPDISDASATAEERTYGWWGDDLHG